MSESNGEFNFDLITRKSKPVQYQGKHYKLMDASEKAILEYEASRGAMERVGDEIRRVISPRLMDSSSVLVSYCLFDDNNQTVPIEILRQWPHHAIETMFEWVVANSPGMKKVETKEEILKEITDLQNKLRTLDERSLEEVAKN